jgi:hypothetical protein
MTKRILAQLVVGLVVSVGGFFCFAEIYYELCYKRGIDIFFGGDKAHIFFGLLLGIPTSVLAGISLVDKFVFKFRRYNILGMVIGFATSFFGAFLWEGPLLDRIGFGVEAFCINSVVLTCCCVIGYNIVYCFMGSPFSEQEIEVIKKLTKKD